MFFFLFYLHLLNRKLPLSLLKSIKIHNKSCSTCEDVATFCDQIPPKAQNVDLLRLICFQPGITTAIGKTWDQLCPACCEATAALQRTAEMPGNHSVTPKNAQWEGSVVRQSLRMWGNVSPVAAVHVEEDDDEAEAVASQVGAATKPGESSSAVLPPCNLVRVEETKSSVSQSVIFYTCSLLQMVCWSLSTCHGARGSQVQNGTPRPWSEVTAIVTATP